MKIHRLNHGDVLKLLPNRPVNGHKGDFGKILLLAGSVGYTGAPVLAALGALRTGAGLVFLGVPESIYQIAAMKLTEPIVFPLPQQDGMLSQEGLARILEKASSMDAVLIGPGLGCSDATEEIVCQVLSSCKVPVVLDADGINLAGKHKDILRGRTSPTILTPHAGEFQRLTGRKPENRLDSAVEAAKDLGGILVLKGHETVITDGAAVYINPTGNPGMAVGGSGDVLAGMIVSLLGQKIPPLEAAACGAWLHGAAGDLCAKELGQYGMLPTDMVQVLPRLLK